MNAKVTDALHAITKVVEDEDTSLKEKKENIRTIFLFAQRQRKALAFEIEAMEFGDGII